MDTSNGVLERSEAGEITAKLFVTTDLYLQSLEDGKIIWSRVWKARSHLYCGSNEFGDGDAVRVVPRLRDDYAVVSCLNPLTRESRSKFSRNWKKEVLTEGERRPYRDLFFDLPDPEFELRPGMLICVRAQLDILGKSEISASDVDIFPVASRSEDFFF